MTSAGSCRPRTSTISRVPTPAWATSTYAIAIDLCSVGVKLPLLITPTRRLSPTMTEQPSRAARLPSSTSPTRCRPERPGVGVEQCGAQPDRLRTRAGHRRRGRGLVVDLNLPVAFHALQVFDDLRAVGGVDHHQPAVGPAIDEHVVFDSALVVADQPV